MSNNSPSLENYLNLVKENFDKLKEMLLSEKFLSGFNCNEKISTYIVYDLTKALGILMDDDWLYPNNTAMTYLLPENDYSNFLCYDETIDPIKVNWNEVDIIGSSIHSELWGLIVQVLQTPKFNWLEETGNLMYIAEAIQTDLTNILSFLSSANSKKESKFLEQQLKVYQNGGFPCGWYGKYPDGQIIVYSPK